MPGALTRSKNNRVSTPKPIDSPLFEEGIHDGNFLKKTKGCSYALHPFVL
jgi:hypothetical protein